MSEGHAPLNTIEIDGYRDYLLAWTGLGGEVDHLVAEAAPDEEARPAAYACEPYSRLNPAYDAGELTRPRWSVRTLCGRRQWTMCPTDAGRAYESAYNGREPAVVAPSCRSCLRILDRQFRPPPPDDRLAWNVARCIEELGNWGSFVIYGLPGDQIGLLRDRVRAEARRRGWRFQSATRDGCVVADVPRRAVARQAGAGGAGHPCTDARHRRRDGADGALVAVPVVVGERSARFRVLRPGADLRRLERRWRSVTTPSPAVWERGGVDPGRWYLVFGREWPEDEALGDYREAAVALVPDLVPDHLISPDVAAVFRVAREFRREHPFRVVFFSDLTRHLHFAGLKWWDVGVEGWVETQDAMLAMRAPSLFMTISWRAHAYLCDASIDGITWTYPDGRTEHDPTEKDRVRAAFGELLDADWDSFIDRMRVAGKITEYQR